MKALRSARKELFCQIIASGVSVIEAYRKAGYKPDKNGRNPFRLRHTPDVEQHETAFLPVKAAAERLLTALDDTQKTKANEILPGLAAHGPGMMHHAGMGPGGMYPTGTNR